MELKAFCLYHSTIRFQVCAQACFCKRGLGLWSQRQSSVRCVLPPTYLPPSRGHFWLRAKEQLGLAWRCLGATSSL